MSKTLTLEKVNEWHPCTEAINWAEPIWNGKEENSIVVLERLIEEEKCDWANWLIVRVMGRKQYLAYAIFAAEQVLEIYETKYPFEKSKNSNICNTTPIRTYNIFIALLLNIASAIKIGKSVNT